MTCPLLQKSRYNIAVIGATGRIGREIVRALEEYHFPVNTIALIASKKSQGKTLAFGKELLRVVSLEGFDFREVDITIFAAGPRLAAKYIVDIVQQSGGVVVDCSSHFNLDVDVPLIVSEVNWDKNGICKLGIIASPNSIVTQIAIALKPLHDYARIKRVVVSTYQSVSSNGKEAMDELYNQTRERFFGGVLEARVLPHPIVFNLIPQIGQFDEDGYTEEELSIAHELPKVFGYDIAVTATCVMVPTFVGHGVSLNIEFESAVSQEIAKEILALAPSVILSDASSNDIYTTLSECVGIPAVFVSKVRKDYSSINGLNMWLVADNMYKGMALNVVQIVQKLIAF